MITLNIILVSVTFNCHFLKHQSYAWNPGSRVLADNVAHYLKCLQIEQCKAYLFLHFKTNKMLFFLIKKCLFETKEQNLFKSWFYFSVFSKWQNQHERRQAAVAHSFVALLLLHLVAEQGRQQFALPFCAPIFFAVPDFFKFYLLSLLVSPSD